MPSTGRIKNNFFDSIPVSRRHLGLFLLISVSYFFEQFDNTNFSFIAPAFMATMKVGPPVLAKINSAYFLGMSLGGLLGGVVADIIGRRWTLILAIFTFSISSIICGFVDSIWVFTFFRALTGFGVFMMMVVSITYMSEMSPKESRGKWEGIISGIGFMVVPLVGVVCSMIIPTAPEAWRYIFYLGGVGLFAGLLCIVYLEESPRWLVSRGKIGDAEKIVHKLTGVNVDLSDTVASLSDKASMKDAVKEMFSPLYMKRTIFLLLLMPLSTICAQVTLQWMPTLLKLNGFTVADALVISTIVSIGIPLGQFTAAIFSDRGGRKMPIVYFSIFIVIVTVGFVIAMTGKNFYILAVLGLLIQVGLVGRGFINHPYVAESYPTKLRSSAVGTQNFVARMSTMAAQPLVPIIVVAWGVSGVFWVMAAMSAVVAAMTAVFGWRSAQRSLEDINEKQTK